MHKGIRILLGLLAIILLILIRMFESELFYDPLIEFFKTDHSTGNIPDIKSGKLILNVSLRFMANSLLTLVLLWLVFKKANILKLTSFLLSIAFVLLLPVFVILLEIKDPDYHMALFYVRRFLIQPIFLLILLPAFYFQRKK